MSLLGDTAEVRFLRGALLFALVPIVGVWAYVSTFLDSSILAVGMAVIVGFDLLLAYRAERVYELLS